MCGIVGYFGTGLAQQDGLILLETMSATIAHRGPDEMGHAVYGDVGFGHRRLSIVGLADGQQPMQNASGDLAITFNGEIFNYVELREDLKARGHRFRTGSDTEVILAAYAEYGPDCLDHFNGDFAFAIWDARKHRLMLARDRMGVRPLYYAWHNQAFYFASEIKALLSVPGIDAEIDPLAMDDIFTLWGPLAPRTAFKGIFELPPAHRMLIENGVPKTDAYWSLDFPDREAVDETRRPDGVAEEVHALLADATALRLRADVPVGSYLSGGLDSAIVAALAAKQVGDRLTTFSVGFESAEHDERAFQQQMVAALGTDHHEIVCSGAMIAEAFPDVVEKAERPILRTAPAPLHVLSGLVRSHGMKVVLTGEGADEVFAGYDIFKEAKVRGFAARDPKSTRRALLFKRLYPYLPGLQAQNAEYLAAAFGVDPNALGDPLFSHRPRFRSTSAAKLFFSTELKRQIGDYNAAEALAERLPERFGRWHPLHQAQYLETRFLLPGYILSAQGDRVAMAHGVEGRFPFLDHRVVELAAGISPGLKLKGLTEKHVLREAFKADLPEGIGQRTKQPYRAPDSQSFVGPDAPEYVSEMLSPSAITETGLFNPRAAQKLVEKAGATGVDGFRDNAGFVGMLSTQLLARFAGVQTAARSDAA